MNVLVLDNAPFVGGAQVNLRHMARLLGAMGHEVTVAVPDDRDEPAAYYRDAGGHAVGVPMRSLNGASPLVVRSLARSLGHLGRLVRERGAQVTFASGQRTGVLAVLLRYVAGIPAVWRLCDLGFARRVRVASCFADRITCVSDALYRRYRHGWHARDTRIVHTGVWAERLDRDELQRRRLHMRRALGIEDGNVVVGAVSNLQRWKGLHVLVEAFAQVARQVPEARLVHVGGPAPGFESYPGYVRSLVERLAVGERCRFLDFQPDVLRHYAAFDVFAHTPIYENGKGHSEAFGQVVAEAMAYRLPVVAADIGGVPEVVARGETGILVETGDVDGTARALRRLLDAPDLRRDLGENGFARFLTRFTIEREAAEYEALFEDAVQSWSR